MVDNAVDACIEKYKRKQFQDDDNHLSISINVIPLSFDETWVRMNDNLMNRNNSNVHLYKITIKDNGIGVKYDQIEKLFGQCYTSTKSSSNSNSNSNIGCFGVGVKAVLLYSKQFTTFGQIIIKTKSKKQFESNKMTHAILTLKDNKNKNENENCKTIEIEKKEIENDEFIETGTIIETIVAGNLCKVIKNIKIGEYFKMIVKLVSRFINVQIELIDFKIYKNENENENGNLLLSKLPNQNDQTIKFNSKHLKKSQNKNKTIRTKQLLYQFGINKNENNDCNNDNNNHQEILSNIYKFGIDFPNVFSKYQIELSPCFPSV